MGNVYVGEDGGEEVLKVWIWEKGPRVEVGIVHVGEEGGAEPRLVKCWRCGGVGEWRVNQGCRGLSCKSYREGL